MRECVHCNGEGHVRCDYCFGTGTSSSSSGSRCSECGGGGKKRCLPCKGRGEKMSFCSLCGGSGNWTPPTYDATKNEPTASAETASDRSPGASGPVPQQTSTHVARRTSNGSSHRKGADGPGKLWFFCLVFIGFLAYGFLGWGRLGEHRSYQPPLPPIAKARSILPNVPAKNRPLSRKLHKSSEHPRPHKFAIRQGPANRISKDSSSNHRTVHVSLRSQSSVPHPTGEVKHPSLRDDVAPPPPDSDDSGGGSGHATLRSGGRLGG